MLIDERARARTLHESPVEGRQVPPAESLWIRETTLEDVPRRGVGIRLATGSALEWASSSNTGRVRRGIPLSAAEVQAYRFADHKENVVRLLRQVTAISPRHGKIVNMMSREKESGDQPAFRYLLHHSKRSSGEQELAASYQFRHR